MFETVKVGRRIAQFRKKKNMTQFELADALGISFQAVSNWERGNSMPDISRLSELAELFDVSIDDILGKKNQVVIDAARGEDVKAEKYSEDDLEEAASIMKPDEVEEIVSLSTAKFAKIVPMLPFLDEDYIDDLAWKFYREGAIFEELMPFMTDDALDKLAEAAYNDGRHIETFCPFISEDMCGELALRAAEDGKDVKPFLPFLLEDDVKKLAFNSLEKGNVKAVTDFLPFMDEDDVKELAFDAFEKGNVGAVTDYLPFMYEDDVKELVEKILKK
ncbi:MAG: helix-turn-helix transcriptional regulator [Clostridia bacterium]|nr:helix-turn-helix transcriptional regulator [Clostridia bacterium]